MDKRRFAVVFTILVCLSLTRLLAQSANALIADLETIDRTIRSQGCPNPKIISNRAMNLFLSDKIGSYLTDFKSLSFYKNYITLNVREGLFSLNHNLFQPATNKIDEPIRTFYVVGVRANVANATTTSFNGRMEGNQLGATLKKTWIASPKTRLTDCNEKTIMDARRTIALATLIPEIKRQEADFLRSLDSIRQGYLPSAQTRKALLNDFYEELTDVYSRRFATHQYQYAVTASRYKTITTHWTNLSVYLPVILQRYTVAGSLAFSTETKKAYSFELALSHTRFWESKPLGRFFLSLEAATFLNNSVRGFLLADINYDQYKRSGGVDTLLLSQRKINSLSVGQYQTFLTPIARLSAVYYPPESHIGISATVEQHIGLYKALNCVLGIPVVLIDKRGAPSANFECQLRYADCTHVVFPHRTLNDNLSVNLTIGVPFSKIIY